MLRYNLTISGVASTVNVQFGELQNACSFLISLLALVQQRSEKPFPILDDDDHVVAFVLPTTVVSAYIQADDKFVESFAKSQQELINLQIATLKSQAGY